MEAEFSNLPWHDAELLDIIVDRRNPGERDQVVIHICWPCGQQNELIFSDCFELEAKMNFGVIAPESIQTALQIDESQKLTEIKNKWAQIGIDLGKLKCFEVRTNSTNSVVRIYALSYFFTRKT